jgi:hypothetical protein
MALEITRKQGADSLFSSLKREDLLVLSRVEVHAPVQVDAWLLDSAHGEDGRTGAIAETGAGHLA